MYSGNRQELSDIMIYNNVEECLAIREYCEATSTKYTVDEVGDMVVDDWRYMTQAVDQSQLDGLLTYNEADYLHRALDLIYKYTMRALLTDGVGYYKLPDDLSDYTVEDIFGMYWAYIDFLDETGYFGLV